MNGADALVLEQERKREFYRQRQQATLQEPVRLGEAVKKGKEAVKAIKEGKKAIETAQAVGEIAAGVAAGGWGGVIAAAKAEAKRVGERTLKALKEKGIRAAVEVPAQEGSLWFLRILWGSLLGVVSFIPCLLGLNLYFCASQGALDNIWPISKKIAPFGFCSKFLPNPLGKWLGIIALLALDFLAIVAIFIILALLAFLVQLLF
jgi:uncharacterized membrane protein